MKAVDKMPLMDLRRARADALASAIMAEIADLVPSIDRPFVRTRLFNILYTNGAAWTTDAERAALGFEGRDPLGWTASERVEAEARKMDALQMVMAHIRFDQTSGHTVPEAQAVDIAGEPGGI